MMHRQKEHELKYPNKLNMYSAFHAKCNTGTRGPKPSTGKINFGRRSSVLMTLIIPQHCREIVIIVVSIFLFIPVIVLFLYRQVLHHILVLAHLMVVLRTIIAVTVSKYAEKPS